VITVIEAGSVGMAGPRWVLGIAHTSAIVSVAASAQKAPVPQTTVRIIRRLVASANPPRRVD
jgi:hypothetical protein